MPLPGVAVAVVGPAAEPRGTDLGRPGLSCTAHTLLGTPSAESFTSVLNQ